MKEPVRWIDSDGEAGAFEREVLRDNLAVDVPDLAADRVWEGVLGVLAAPLDVGAGAAPKVLESGARVIQRAKATAAGSKAVTTLMVVKSVLIGGAVGAIVTTTALVTRPADTPPTRAAVRGATSGGSAAGVSAPAPARSLPVQTYAEEPALVPAAPGHVSATSGGSVAREPSPAAQPSVAAFAEPDSAVGDGAAAALRASELRAEAALIRQARAELRQGALAQAFGTLEASRERISTPALVEEREALMIELLVRSGKRELATTRAREFSQRFPNSALGAEVRRLVGTE